MPRFMDFHQDLKLPAEAIAQIADDVRNGRADQFGVQQASSTTTPKAPSSACSTAQTRKQSAATTPRSASTAATSIR
jgi:hypothetical protein